MIKPRLKYSIVAKAVKELAQLSRQTGRWIDVEETSKLDPATSAINDNVITFKALCLNTSRLHI